MAKNNRFWPFYLVFYYSTVTTSILMLQNLSYHHTEQLLQTWSPHRCLMGLTSKGSYRSKKKIIKVWMMMKWMGELFLLTLPLLALPLLNLPSLTFPSLSFHSLTLPLLPLLSLALPGLSTSFCVSRFYPHCWEFWVIDKLLKLLKYCFVIFSLLLPS